MVILHDIRHRDTRGVKQDWHIKPSHCPHQLFELLLILVFDVRMIRIIQFRFENVNQNIG